MNFTVSAHSKTSAIRSAFTLPEVMVAVGIMSTMVVGLYLGFSQGFGVVQVARENLRATQILQEKMETIRLFSWNDIQTAASSYSFTNYFYPIATSGSKGVAYSGTRTIANAPVTESYSSDLKLVIFQLN